jgi:hypothetical protein
VGRSFAGTVFDPSRAMAKVDCSSPTSPVTIEKVEYVVSFCSTRAVTGSKPRPWRLSAYQLIDAVSAHSSVKKFSRSAGAFEFHLPHFAEPGTAYLEFTFPMLSSLTDGG